MGGCRLVDSFAVAGSESVVDTQGPKGKVVTFEHSGVEVSFLVVNELDHIQRFHLYEGIYELAELRIISKHFPQDGVFLDIGSNVGNHAIYAAKFLQARSVIAIEANPAAFAILQANVELNDLHHVIETDFLGFGLSDAEGRARAFVKDQNNLGGGKLIADEQGTIPVVTGDALLGDRRVDFLKLDVEGMELRVLEGLKGVVTAQRPPIFVEVDDANLDAFLAWVEANAYEIVERYRRYRANENYMLVPSKKTG